MLLRLNLRHKDSTIFFGKPTWMTADGKVLPRPVLRGRVCGLVHGYNVKNAFGAYREIYAQIQHWYDWVIGITWPGSEFTLAFWLARARARKAGRLLAQELSTMRCTLDLEGHSLGCMVVLEAGQAGLRMRNALLTAAAVDNEALERMDIPAQMIHVFHSRNDEVLSTAYRFARLDRALGLSGPEHPERVPLNVQVHDMSPWIDRHGDYKRSTEFFTKWIYLLREVQNAN